MKHNVSVDNGSSVDSFRYAPILALVCAAFFWSGNFIVGRALRDVIAPVTLNYWRWMVALVILLPFSFVQLWEYRRLLLSIWKTIIGLGLTGIAAFHICVYTALLDTTAINALIILSTAPVVIILSSWWIFKETISSIRGLGILVSLIGAIVLLVHGNSQILLQLEINKGDIWMLLAVPIWSIYCLLLKQRPAKLPHMALLCSSVITGLVFMTPVYLLRPLKGIGMTLNVANVMAILYISVFASVIAFFLWNYGVSKIGPNKASIYLHLMPFFGSILSICFLDEGLAPFHFIGAVLVFTGIALTGHTRDFTKRQVKCQRSDSTRKEKRCI